LSGIAHVVGPGEAAYLVQVRRVAALLETRVSHLFPRLSATLWPEEAERLCAGLGAAPAEALTAFDALLRRHLAGQIPAAVSSELEQFGRDVRQRAERLSQAAAALDTSLPQLVESA